MTTETKAVSPVEIIKDNSNYLRGTIKEGLIDELTGSLAADDTQLTKFHGIYQQTARDQDAERKKQKLEPLYSFMVRVRIPGGVATPAQWLEMDRLANTYANSTLKLTTRQAFQFHGILKRNLKKHIAEINNSLLDTVAACGDVNRNVMCSPNPEISNLHQEAYDFSKTISEHLMPQTTAYHEIWLDKNLVASGDYKEDSEPIYGKTYLPRKFKIAIAVPPHNDTDVYTNDIGLVAIGDKNNKLIGYNFIVGGGMGNTIGDKSTYPRLGNLIGFYKKEDALQIIEEIVKIQRDFGNRAERKNARLKYTIATRGIEWFTNELDKRSGLKAEKAHEFEFKDNIDRYGWLKCSNDTWNYTLFVEHGRVSDSKKHSMKTALKEIAEMEIGDFRLTGNQNLTIGGIPENNKADIEKVLTKHNVDVENNFSPTRLNSIACVALNTCTLAHAEAETYLPGLMDKIEELQKKHKIFEQAITIRMTGCPNGCARPYNAEIGFVGRAIGLYNMYLGGNYVGKRINVLYKEMLKEEEILNELDGLFEKYATNRKQGEHFGDFVIRTGVVFVNEF